MAERPAWKRRDRPHLDREELEEARDVNLRRIGEALGLVMPAGQRRNGRCPLPSHVDRNPSFWISSDGRWWKCFGCQKSGDAVQLVREVRSCDLRAAIAFITAWRGGRTEAPVESVSKISASDRPGPDPEVYGRLMNLLPLGERGRSYLAGRGIGAEIIAVCGVGEVTSERMILDALLREFGEDRLDSAGLLARAAGGRRRLLFRAPGLVFPFLEGGTPMYLQERNLGASTTRWVGLNGQRKRAYRLIRSDGRRGVWICEGLTDALTAAELGHDALGILGADGTPDAETLALLRGRDVYVVGDNDEKGRSFAKRLLRFLSAHAIAADEFKVPCGFGDLNAWQTGRRVAGG